MVPPSWLASDGERDMAAALAVAVPLLEELHVAPPGVAEAGAEVGAQHAAVEQSQWPLRNARRLEQGTWRSAVFGAHTTQRRRGCGSASHLRRVCLLLRRLLRRVTYHGVETLLVVLDSAVLGKSSQLRQAIGAAGWPEALVDEPLEALPQWHALVLLEGVVEGLGHPSQGYEVS